VKIFAISDLHLSFGVNKPMDIFGQHWAGHPERLKHAWFDLVSDQDIVLVPGDISWAMKLDDARKDLDFIHSLPGRKVIIKGNHDYWWSSLNKVTQVLPQSIIPLQNTAAVFDGIGIAGSRLWIDPELNLENATDEDKKIWKRELARFGLSLKALPDDTRLRIFMTHFPPISLDGVPGKAASMAQDSRCDIWIFGHMHLGTPLNYNGFNRIIGRTKFEFVSADFLEFRPKLLYDSDID